MAKTRLQRSTTALSGSSNASAPPTTSAIAGSDFEFDPLFLKGAGITLLAAEDLGEGFAKYQSAKQEANQIENRSKELDARGKVSLLNIAKKEKQVQGVQETAFIKAGVALEGSALNVIAETAENAAEESRMRQRELDFERDVSNIESAVQRSRAKFAVLETALNVGTTVATASAK